MTSRWPRSTDRKASLLVAGQDVLTADNVGLKLSLLLTYQVRDPVKAVHETQNWQGDLDNFAQLALRGVVGGIAVEALLNQRLEICAASGPRAARSGEDRCQRRCYRSEGRDAPGRSQAGLRRCAETEAGGQAALERARGESADLRNLANAARVLEGNPVLINLRLMQSLSAAQSSGNRLVLGVPGFVPLKNGQTSAPERKPEDGAS